MKTCLGILCIVIALSTVQAATVSWTGTSGTDVNFSTPGNWYNSVLPNPGDDLVFPQGSLVFLDKFSLQNGIVFGNVTIYDGVNISGNPASNIFGVTSVIDNGTAD